MSFDRINWAEYALLIADTVSKRSQDPYKKVGACALNNDHMVLAVGYNGLAPGKDIKNSFWEDRDSRRPFMVHAEINCLSMCKRGEVELLAVTLLPCSYCAAMIAAYGIKSVIYGEEYDRDSKAHDIFSFYRVNLFKIDQK